jgi:hypothetical protein
LPIRLGQAQAHGGLGQARGGPVARSAGQAPSLQGTLGRVPSHLSLAASAASASVIPTSGYFGSQKRQVVEINARRVICPKHARGAHGSRDYARHQEAATKAIPYTSSHCTKQKKFHMFFPQNCARGTRNHSPTGGRRFSPPRRFCPPPLHPKSTPFYVRLAILAPQ